MAEQNVQGTGMVVVVPVQPVQTAEQAVVAAAVQATVPAVDDVARQEAEREANRTVAACVNAYRKGESSFRKGAILAGKLADTFLHQKMAIGGERGAKTERANAVDRLRLELLRVGADDHGGQLVNRLIRTYHAHRLLSDAADAKLVEGVPYNHYREYYVQLVNRVKADTMEEGYVLLPGFEDQCRALFARCVKDELAVGTVKTEVSNLQRQYAHAEQTRAKAAKDEQERVAREARAVADKAKAEAAAATKAVSDAEALAAAIAVTDASKAEDKARLTAAAEKARQEQVKTQQDAIKAVELAAAEQRKSKAAQDDARNAARAVTTADRKAGLVLAKEAAPITNMVPAGTSQGKYPKPPADADPKDVAEMVVSFIADNVHQTECFEALCKLLKAKQALSAKGMRALDAALVVLAAPVAKVA